MAHELLFPATGDIQTYHVPTTGGYLIEACGAQAPAGDPSAARGDLVKGLFYLNRGDVLKIVVGCREPSPTGRRRMTCGGEGGSVVWRGVGDLPLPAKLLLAAGGGPRDRAPGNPPAWGESFNAGAFQTNSPAVHAGNGYVSVTPLTPVSSAAPGDRAVPKSAAHVDCQPRSSGALPPAVPVPVSAVPAAPTVQF